MRGASVKTRRGLLHTKQRRWDDPVGASCALGQALGVMQPSCSRMWLEPSWGWGGAGPGGVTELKVRMGCGCSGKDGSHGNGEEVTALRDVWGKELTGPSQTTKGQENRAAKDAAGFLDQESDDIRSRWDFLRFREAHVVLKGLWDFVKM